MYFVWLSVDWQPSARQVLSQSKRGGGRKKKVWFIDWSEQRKQTWRELCIAQGRHRWMELQARSEKEKDLCSVQTKGQKKNHQSGRAALKWRKQLFIQWGNGQVRWAGSSNQKTICWPGQHALEARNKSCPPGHHAEGPVPAGQVNNARMRH